MNDLIDRQAAIDAMCSVCGNDCDKSEFKYDVPQDEQMILCPEHYALSILPPVQPDTRLVELPKKHGRLVDADALLKDMRDMRTYDILFALERAKIIVEAEDADND